MCTWKGWNEREIRDKLFNPNSSNRSQSAMAGFTAINVPAAASPRYAAPSEVPNDASRDLRTTNFLTGDGEPKTIVSDYLGRGDPDGVDVVTKKASGPLRGTGTKQTVSRGKKRIGNAEHENGAKRQKTSDISNGRPITKAATKGKKSSATKAVTSNADNHLKAKSSEELSKLDQTAASATNEAGREPRSKQPKQRDEPTKAPAPLVSVIAPSTSMSSLCSSSYGTSIEAIRSSPGQSATVYQGANGQKNTDVGMNFTPSWSKQGTETPAHANKEVTTRVLRPRHSNAANIVSTLSFPTDEKNPGATEKSTRPQITKKAKREVRPMSDNTVNDINEDFIGDDDDDYLIEALNDVNTVQTNTLPTLKKPQVSVGTKQLPTHVHVEEPAQTPTIKRNQLKRKETPILTPDDEFMHLCDEDEAEIANLTDSAEAAAAQRPPTPTYRNKRLNMREVDPHEDYGGALLSEADQQLLGKHSTFQPFLPHLTSQHNRKSTNPPNATTLNPPSPAKQRPIILRKPFPPSIRDRSPIAGASNKTTLRTCFRLGEALNLGSRAARTGIDVVLELYARVTSSYREDSGNGGKGKQHFVFRDLYHDRGPYLEGIGVGWMEGGLGDLDSRVFLSDPPEGSGGGEDGDLARVVGRLRRGEMGAVGMGKWWLEVLCIWEAGWEDIEYVAGIYAKDSGLAVD